LDEYKKEMRKLTAGKIIKILEINSKIFIDIVTEKEFEQVKQVILQRDVRVSL